MSEGSSRALTIFLRFVPETSLVRVGWPRSAAHCLQRAQRFVMSMSEVVHRRQDSCAGTYWQQQEHSADFPSAASAGSDGCDSSSRLTEGRRQSVRADHACLGVTPRSTVFPEAALFSIILNPYELFLWYLCPGQAEVPCALSLPALAFQCGTRNGPSWTRTSTALTPCGFSMGWRSPRGRRG